MSALGLPLPHLARLSFPMLSTSDNISLLAVSYIKTNTKAPDEEKRTNEETHNPFQQNGHNMTGQIQTLLRVRYGARLLVSQISKGLIPGTQTSSHPHMPMLPCHPTKSRGCQSLTSPAKLPSSQACRAEFAPEPHPRKLRCRNRKSETRSQKPRRREDRCISAQVWRGSSYVLR